MKSYFAFEEPNDSQKGPEVGCSAEE